MLRNQNSLVNFLSIFPKDHIPKMSFFRLYIPAILFAAMFGQSHAHRKYLHPPKSVNLVRWLDMMHICISTVLYSVEFLWGVKSYKNSCECSFAPFVINIWLKLLICDIDKRLIKIKEPLKLETQKICCGKNPSDAALTP